MFAPILALPNFNLLLKLNVMLAALALRRSLPKPNNTWPTLMRSWMTPNLIAPLMTKSFALLFRLLPIGVTILNQSPSRYIRSTRPCRSSMGRPSLIQGMPSGLKFLQSFSFTCKHKNGKKNVVIDALARRYAFLFTLKAKILGLYTIQELYKEVKDFQGIVANPKDHNSYIL